MKKRLLAWLLSLSITAGLLPVYAMAADPQPQLPEDGDSGMQIEQSTVEVEYTTSNRSKATITYHKEGVAANPFNLLFLVDTSRQGELSHEAFELMLRDSGMGYIYDYEAASNVQLIGYQQDIMRNTGIVGNKSDLTNNFGNHGTPGEGTANELVALEEAINAVKTLKEKHGENSTVVFWVLGKEFGVQDTDAIEAKLKELKSLLNDESDALITWQLADQPNELLTQYATMHSHAHSDPNDKHPAAYAISDSVQMQEAMAADLEEIVHDHYHNIGFSLELDSAQTLVTKITSARYESSSSMASLTATLREDGKGLDISIERLCRQIDLDFILEVELDTSVLGTQTVIPEGKIIADHNGDNGGLHAGLFDDKIIYDLELDYPAAVLDRTAHKITFENAEGVKPILDKLAGETVTLPMGDHLTHDGNSFGGWIVSSGPNKGHRYEPGEIISMPDTDMVLIPAFAHLEVELDIDYEQGEPVKYGNQMSDVSRILHLYDMDLGNGITVDSYDIASIRIIDALPIYSNTPSEADKNKVTLFSVGGNSVDDVVYARHVGKTSSDAVVAYLTASQSSNGKYDMVIAGPGGVKAPADCSQLFFVFSNCTSIYLDALDTTGVTDMSNMFDGDRSLTTLKFGDGWDTSAVTNMKGMFSGCNKLENLDLSKFITVEVTDMSEMFFNCYKLNNLDFRSFDTAKVENMSQMFNNCSRLSSLDLSTFNTAKVKDMSEMFSFCESLATLTFGNEFDTSQVTDMLQMFYACTELSSLDLSRFNTRNVTTMAGMFSFCESLTTLTFPDTFDTSNVTRMHLMFFGCEGLITLDLSGFNTAKVTDMSQMFANCYELDSVTFGEEWTNDIVTNMSKMFWYCKSLTSLKWNGFKTPSVTNMSEMFSSCIALPTLDLSSFNTSEVTNMSQMFAGCGELSDLTLGGNFKTSEVTNMSSMFAGCSKLGTLDVSGFDTSKVKNMYRMFASCQQLSSLNLSSFDTTNVTDISSMFSDCSNLVDLTFGNNFNTANVTSMSQLFSGCSKLANPDLRKLDTSNVKNMSQMFQSCKAITSLTFPNTFDTSNVTDMSEMFYSCTNLEEITFGDKFVISDVKDISQMFSWCSKLKTISNLGLGESNVLGNMNGFFSGLEKLESVTFRAPSTGAEFSKLSTLTNMFSGCTNLKTVDMSNWKLPNLTNTSSMFSNCSSLEYVNLSWSGIAATAGNYSIDSMFDGIPATATLETGENSSVMLDAIKAAFDAAKGAPANQLISQPNLDQVPPTDEPQTPTDTPDEPETPTDTPDEPETPTDTPDEPETPTDTPDEPQTPTDTPDEPETPTDTPDEPETPTDTPDEPETPTDTPDEPQTPTDTPDEPETPTDTPDEPETPTDTPQESETPTENSDGAGLPETPSAMSLNMTQAQTLPVQTAYDTDDTDSALYVYPTMVNPNDTITYKVTVKYVGNVGVKSGLITMNFPIPDGIIEFIGKGNPGDVDYEAPGWQIATTQIKDSGSSGGFMGGRVVKDPWIVENDDGTKVLQGVFEGLYAGTEITVSIRTTVTDEHKLRDEKGYIFWDGTAYASDNAGTATSRTVRLWNHHTDSSLHPTVGTHTLTYKFTGDVPSDAILPYVEQVEAGEHTSASEPTTQEGYTFDGWYFPDGKTKVEPGETFTMPPSDFVLTGRWKLADDKVQRITVMYKYDGNHIPKDAPKLVTEQTVKVGQTHYITKINQDANYHKFGGWKPTLSIINNQEIFPTEQPDGTYQGVDPSNPDKVYTIDIAKNVLSTDQFKDQDNVIVTFRGPWIPYTGTIKFDSNGGTGSMDDMNNVTWDTESPLPANLFRYPDTSYKFVGWAKTPSGAIVKADQARANGLIDQDGEEVTLYAIWKRSTYRIGYDLNHVRSSSNQTTVALGENYSTILRAKKGYEMSEVSVTMGGAVITSQVYDQSTGEISISNISGNIIIKADATKKGTPPPSEHKITVSVTNGTATPSGDVTVQDGEDQTISFTPNEGYVFESATVDGDATSLTDNTYTFRNVVSDRTISVVYQKDDSGDSGDGSGTKKYPIYVNYSGHGIATSDKQQAAAGETVTVNTNGTVISITAVDKNGNELSITDQGNGSFTFTMPKSAATVTVEFEPLPDVANPDDTGVSGWLDTRNHFSYLDGYPDSTFRPGNNMTRAEVAQMFYNLLLNKDIAITVSFSDVKPEAWYATAINTLASLDILEGVGKDQFAPERAITRAEFTAIAMRFAKLDKSGINIFSDVQESDWFYDYVVGSIQYGWITGYPDGTFRPNNTITRSEVTTITNRMLGRAADQTYVKNHTADLHLFADVTNTDWAYYQIVEATNSHEFEKVNGAEVWKKLK